MTKSEIVNILEGMYILLMLDQLPNGLWGRSVAVKKGTAKLTVNINGNSILICTKVLPEIKD